MKEGSLKVLSILVELGLIALICYIVIRVLLGVLVSGEPSLDYL